MNPKEELGLEGFKHPEGVVYLQSDGCQNCPNETKCAYFTTEVLYMGK